MKFSTRYSSPYLKADDLPTRRLRVTINDVVEEEMGFPRECKLVVYFRELEKGLVLNKTNATTLATAFGDETQASVGQAVDLVLKPGSYDGRDIEVVRIEIPAGPAPGRHSPNDRLDDEAAAAAQSDDDIPY